MRCRLRATSLLTISICLLMELLTSCQGAPPPGRQDRAGLLAVDVHDLADVIRKRYRLQPDLRLQGAVADLYKIATGKKPPTVAMRFEAGRWRVLSGADEVGSVPEIPSFEDGTRLLASWAARVARSSETTAVQANAAATMTSGYRLDPLETLHQLASLPAPCRSGQCDKVLLHRATDGLVWLSLLSLDSLQQADSLYSRAWALLALEKALDAAGIGDHEVLMARALGYERAAAEAASSLPEQATARLLAERDLQHLSTACLQAPADMRCQYFLLLLLAESQNEASFSAARQRLPEPDRNSLPVLGLLVRLAAFDNGAEPGRDLATRALDVVRPSGPWSVQLSSRRTEGETQTFETAVQAGSQKMSGGSLDAATVAGFLRGAFYSGLFDEANFYLDRLSSSPAAQEFASALSKPAAGTASELKRWVEIRAQLIGGGADVKPLSAAVTTMKSVGALPLTRMSYSIQYYASSTDPLRRRSMPDLFALLDTRPLYLNEASSVAWNNLTSPLLYARNTRAAAREAPFLARQLTSTAALLDGDGTKLKAMAQDERLSIDSRLQALYGLQELGQADDAFLREQFGKLAREDPEGTTIDALVWYLERKGDVGRALHALQAHLKRRTGPRNLVWAHLVTREARVLVDLGQSAKALSVLQPALSTGKAEVLEEAIELEISQGEAEQALGLAESAHERYPNDEVFGTLIGKCLWRKGDYAGAASQLARLEAAHQWTASVAAAFADAFANQPQASVIAAFEALKRAQIQPHRLADLAIALGKKGDLDTATGLIEPLADPAPEWNEEIRLATYDLIVKRSGADTALAWLQRSMPAPRDQFANSLYQLRKYELIWGFFPPGGKGPKVRVVRLLKAASLLHLKEKQSARRDALIAEIKSDPDQDEFFVRAALFLLGLRDESAILRPLPDITYAASIGWAMGLKACGEGRFEDAEPWFQVALESGQNQEPPNAWSFVILSDWLVQKRSLRLLAKTGTF
jgi:hypothetical protein